MKKLVTKLVTKYKSWFWPKKTIVEWSLQDIQKPLGVATYQQQAVVDRTVAELEQRKKQDKDEV
ncbi:MAG: hypothetical protein IJZ45_02840 [Bacteroidaceae bacterium]|nr:hypothetical protein [Bacteroidaceae bacterium]